MIEFVQVCALPSGVAGITLWQMIFLVFFLLLPFSFFGQKRSTMHIKKFCILLKTLHLWFQAEQYRSVNSNLYHCFLWGILKS